MPLELFIFQIRYTTLIIYTYFMQNQSKEEKSFAEGGSLYHKLFHNSIGAFVGHLSGKKYYGTGFLISNNIVMTVAHNLYDRKSKQECKDIKFYLQVNGVGSTCYQVEDFRYMQAYKTCEQNEKVLYDIALIKLKTEVKFNNGYINKLANYFLQKKQFLQISPSCPKCLKQTQAQLSIFGYPHYKDNYDLNDERGEHIKLRQFGLTKSNCIQRIDQAKHAIYYKISTQPGQSGSPVVMGNKAIAVHAAAGGQKQSVNIGRLINAELVDLLKQWCTQLKGCPISINEDQCCHMPKKVKEVVKDDSQSYQRNITIFYGINQTEILLENAIVTRIDITKTLNLLYLSLRDNRISRINISNNAQLVVLNIQNNQLSAIDLSSNLQLKDINIAGNKLSSIDTTKNIKLIWLYVFNNKLKNISLSFIAKKPIYEYLWRYYFVNQDAKTCLIHLLFQAKQAQECKELIKKWELYYQECNPQKNRYNCTFSFIAEHS